MSYEIVNMSQKLVAGIGVRTTNENMKCINDIGGKWKEFFSTPIYSNIKNKTDKNTIGLYTEYEGDITKPYEFYACCEVEEFSTDCKEVTNIIIPADKYAKFSKVGNPEIIVAELWQEIWGTELNRKYTYDYEIYYNDSRDMDHQIVEIYIGIS